MSKSWEENFDYIEPNDINQNEFNELLEKYMFILHEYLNSKGNSPRTSMIVTTSIENLLCHVATRVGLSQNQLIKDIQNTWNTHEQAAKLAIEEYNRKNNV